MENASKALLIAGAILVCILIIGIGMVVYQSTQGTIAEGIAQMSSQEKDMFNSQFTQYAGNRVNGSSVKALLQKVRSNNTANADIEGKVVTVTGTVATGKDGTIEGTELNKINTARNYTVTVDDTDNDGLVDTINIVAVGGTSNS